jgi:DNA-binding CsgD family transcriptional regulator
MPHKDPDQARQYRREYDRRRRLLPPRMPPSLSTTQQTRIAELYREGMTSIEIGERQGISSATVIRALRALGERIRSAGHRHTLNENAFDEISESSAYWVGFAMADGCVLSDPKTRGLRVSLASRDRGHLETLAKFLGSNKPVKVGPNRGSYGKNCYVARLQVRSNRIADRLAQFGVVPRKTSCARVEILEEDRHFWRGMVDGDGYVFLRSKFNYPHAGLCGTPEIVGQFVEFVRRHVPDANPHIRSSVVAPTIKTAVVAGRQAQSLVRLLYADATVYLPRKMEIARKILARQFPRLISLTEVDEMRLLRASGVPIREIAERMRVSNCSAWRIVTGRTWTRIDPGRSRPGSRRKHA